MCGPSGAEKSDQASMDQFAGLLRSNYGELFGEQQAELGKLNASLSPIVAAGPSQAGFSGAEKAALQTGAINAAGAATQSAEQAARNFGAGEGGGSTSGLTSGITKQIESAIASQQAGNLGTAENNINLADYQQGNANYWKAAGGMNALAGQYNPNAAMGGATSAGEQGFQEASQINQEQQQMSKDIAGFATAAIGAAPDIIKSFSGAGDNS